MTIANNLMLKQAYAYIFVLTIAKSISSILQNLTL